MSNLALRTELFQQNGISVASIAVSGEVNWTNASQLETEARRYAAGTYIIMNLAEVTSIGSAFYTALHAIYLQTVVRHGAKMTLVKPRDSFQASLLEASGLGQKIGTQPDIHAAQILLGLNLAQETAEAAAAADATIE